MASITFTREGQTATATPALEGDPVICGDNPFAWDLRDALIDTHYGSWLPRVGIDTPVYNVCAAAFACGADIVSTRNDADTEFPFASFLRSFG